MNSQCDVTGFIVWLRGKLPTDPGICDKCVGCMKIDELRNLQLHVYIQINLKTTSAYIRREFLERFIYIYTGVKNNEVNTFMVGNKRLSA